MLPTPSTSLRRALLLGLAAAAFLGVTACASTGTGSDGAEPSAGPTAAEATASEETGDDYVQADVDFMQGMIHHHAQAIVMARMAPTRATGPGVSRLAARILNSQKTEISLMADWLRARGETVPEYAALAEDAEGGAGTGGNDPDRADPGPIDGWDEGPQMPGVLSDQKMARLHEAHGEEFDRLFLTYMVDHHQGAVTMVERLVAQPRGARGARVFELASGIRSDQEMEIDRMRDMLRELLFGSESP